MGKLKANKVNSYPAGNHSDGDCLYLRVKESGARSWVFRYKIDGKPRELGLGSVTVRPIKEARHLAVDMRRAIAAGMNPKSLLSPKQQTKTFADYAGELIQLKKAGWRNEKHAQQWVNTLAQYALPVIGGKQIRDIDLVDIKRILTPLWADKTETANRVRMRIEAVLDYGYLHENLSQANPARWKGFLDKIFAPRKKVQPVEGHNAIHYDELPQVMARLREETSISAMCLRWIALTACRSGEARGMTWEELDLKRNTWTIPACRMKAGKKHRIPLSNECIRILDKANMLRSLGKDGLVFFNRDGRQLSDFALLKTLKALSNDDATVHGLRSTFRDWVAAKTQHQREIAEFSLAHVPSGAEGAYWRSDVLEKRTKLMDDWGDYLEGETLENEKREYNYMLTLKNQSLHE